MARAARTIAVLSPAYLESEYGTAEWQAAWASDPAGAQRKLLVTRVKECERPGLLAGVVGVDLFGMTEAEARARLRAMVSSAIAGRAKPDGGAGVPGGRAVPRRAAVPRGAAAGVEGPGRATRISPAAARSWLRWRRRLASGSTVTVQSLHGMGGVGKTQLATEFAYAHAGDYDLVYWIAAEEPATIPDQFSALARQLGLDPVADPEVLQAQVHEPAARRAGLAAGLR